MGEMTRDDLDRMADRIEARMRDGFEGVHTRLDHLNGRTRKAETAIAILNDRSPGRIGMLAGGAVTGLFWVIYLIVQVVKG